ncbi:Hemolysin activation/secretion protein [Noviherbaspirillum humi]|uniref:Hemolysin activation/secretion protein n=1 Tax=Noviherbaspirillum humi TaxID=1688639 RepID=A0A239EVL5_9BURK|nr:POTRA domain-containing protein [Noviherbaspirillum humi]SNS48083.1 Hemolysin activation/secretion protein [Noviherbaspirillum humi]
MRRKALALAVLAGYASLTDAQTVAQPGAPAGARVPEAGDIGRDLGQDKERFPQPARSVQPSDDIGEAEPGAPTVTVARFEFDDIKLVERQELEALMAPLIGRVLTIRQLERAVQRVTRFYRERGWLAVPYLPRQEVRDGVIRVGVLEGVFDKVETTGNAAQGDIDFARHIVTSRLTPGKPIRVDDLERGLLIANDLPGTLAVGTLGPGSETGTVGLKLKIDRGIRYRADGEFRNFGNRATGVEQLVLGGEYFPENASGASIAARSLASEGMLAHSLAYNRYVGRDGWRIGAQAGHLKYKLIEPYEALDARGESNTLGGAASYPLLRSETANLRTTVSTLYRHSIDYALNVPLRRRRIVNATAGIDGDRADGLWGGGVNWGGVSLTVGRANLRGVIQDYLQDQAGPKVHGPFAKLNFSLNRRQELKDGFSVVASFNLQHAWQNLDASERFVLGGPTNIRAYPVGEAPGDSGMLASVELQRRLRDGWQMFGFIDSGRIQVNQKPWAASASAAALPNRYALHGIGAGARVTTPEGWRVEATAAMPIGSNPGSRFRNREGDGTAHDFRFWIRIAKPF